MIKKKRLVLTLASLSALVFLMNEHETAFASTNDRSISQHSVVKEKLIEEKTYVNRNQLVVKDSDIDTWMPNKSLQAEVLKRLISAGYLPEGSTIDQVTKELLASIDSSAVLYFSMSTFKGDEITTNLSEGLQYINPEASVTLSIAGPTEYQLKTIDLQQLHANVDEWNLFVVNPKKVENPTLIKKVIDAKLPAKENNWSNPGIFYLQGSYQDNGQTFVPTLTKTLDISKNLFPVITLSEHDFWNGLEKDKYYTDNRVNDVVYHSNGSLVLLNLFKFDIISDTVYQGTILPTEQNTALMQQVFNNPQYFYDSISDTYTYDDGQHQKIELISNIYVNFSNGK